MKKKADSTLQRLTKAELIEELRITEMNMESIEALYHQQIENVKDWEPVKHAHWIHHAWKTIVACSWCYGEVNIGDPKAYKYCPFCGAKMDEVT